MFHWASSINRPEKHKPLADEALVEQAWEEYERSKKVDAARNGIQIMGRL